MLRDTSQTPKDTQRAILLIANVQNPQIHTRKVGQWLPGAGASEWGVTDSCTQGLPLGGTKMLYEETKVMVAQRRERAKCL